MGSITKVKNGWRARWRTPSGASRSQSFRRRVDAENKMTESKPPSSTPATSTHPGRPSPNGGPATNATP